MERKKIILVSDNNSNKLIMAIPGFGSTKKLIKAVTEDLGTQFRYEVCLISEFFRLVDKEKLVPLNMFNYIMLIVKHMN